MDFYHLPAQWRDHALRSNITSLDGPETWSTIGTGGGGDRQQRQGAGGYGGDGGGGRTGHGGGGGRGRGGDGGGRGRGGGRGEQGGRRGNGNSGSILQPTKAQYPERYGPGNKNVKAAFNLLKIVKPLGLTGKAINWNRLAKKCGKTVKALCAWHAAPNGICVKYACGECVDPNCEADHARHYEMPRGWLAAVSKTLREGVSKM